jgi:hypothetical protein
MFSYNSNPMSGKASFGKPSGNWTGGGKMAPETMPQMMSAPTQMPGSIGMAPSQGIGGFSKPNPMGQMFGRAAPLGNIRNDVGPMMGGMNGGGNMGLLQSLFGAGGLQADTPTSPYGSIMSGGMGGGMNNMNQNSPYGNMASSPNLSFYQMLGLR